MNLTAIESDLHVASPSSPFNSSSNSATTFPDVSSKTNFDANAEAAKVEQYTPAPDDDRINLADSSVASNVSTDNAGTDSVDHSRITDQTYTPVPEIADSSSEQACENDRTFKPSKIPVLKAKHMENASDTSVKRASPAVEEHDVSRASLNAYSGIPTSPITGKKYRSPLSTTAKSLDRSRKMTNGSIAHNNSCDNVDSADVPSIVNRPNVIVTKNIAEESGVALPAIIKGESNSGRDTPNFNNKPSGDASNAESKDSASPASNETLNSERKPRFKWMFGPHKNANVVSDHSLERRE